MSVDASVVSLATNVDQTWTMVAGILVVFMQAGFSMVEAGTVQPKNTQGILLKNMLDTCIGAIVWWMIGYGLAFGEDSGKFIGSNLFFGLNKDYENAHYTGWFFQWAFSATAATIVSGAVAERVNFIGYALFMIMMTAFIYPVIVHWTWGGGWLVKEGVYTDFAGSGIVHMTGGVAAFCGAKNIGARTGRWDPAKVAQFEPHNVPMIVLGCFILWFGWFGFNCGSTTAMTGGSSNTAALVAMTTTLSGAMGGLTVFTIRFIATPQHVHDICALANGILAGLVSVTAACDGVYGWAAIVIGFIGGLLYIGASHLLKILKVDDPVDAFAVHGVCGAWGVLAVAFFNFDNGILYGGEDAAKLLLWQFLGIVCIAAWSGTLSVVTFIAISKCGLLRLSIVEEEEGDEAHSGLHLGSDTADPSTIGSKKVSHDHREEEMI